jgi:hypothetical protein
MADPETIYNWRRLNDPEWVTSRTLCKKNGYPFAVCLNN